VQSISKRPVTLISLGLLTSVLIAVAIAFELLPEEEAKSYVVPILVTALFACIAQFPIYKRASN
jgi:hypothetical protein